MFYLNDLLDLELGEIIDSKLRIDGLLKKGFLVEERSFGKTFCYKTSKVSNPMFNRILALNPQEKDRIPEIIDFFASSCPRIDLLCHGENSELTPILRDYGFSCTEFYSLMINDNLVYQELPPEVTFNVCNDSEVNIFADAVLQGEGILPSNPIYRELFDLVSASSLGKERRKIIMRVNGENVGSCSLIVDNNGLGVFSGVSTYPKFRNLGFHRIMLQYRINLAIQLGAKLVVTSPISGSVSQRNQQRMGFRNACNKSIWTR